GVVPDAATPALVAVTNANPNTPAASPLPTSGDSALVPYQGPEGSPGDSIVTPATDRIANYLVQPGDTLSGIAATYGVSVNTIIWANGLSSARDVHPGDNLIILPVSGVKHTVAKGDTLASLAKRYGADQGEIASYNGLSADAALAAGSTIIIPGGELAAAAPAKAPSKKLGGGKVAVGAEPYLGGSGAAQNGYWTNPVPGGLIWQGIHGWNAVDIAAPKGTPIRAAAAGVVTVARSNGAWNGGYGNYVVITHANGTQTLYAHMTHAIVTSGQEVNAGQVIGYVGATGKATGPHLHFEVRGAANPFRNCTLKSACSPE
ncbi:M23 family metallopeptidase, partial [Patescibacteria group bacterium]|nr:M23 family metallopeptidase [Patescibacteria group bacterium]